MDYLNATTSKGDITSRTHAAGHTKVRLAELVIAEAVHARHHDDARGVARCVSLLADELGGVESTGSCLLAFSVMSPMRGAAAGNRPT